MVIAPLKTMREREAPSARRLVTAAVLTCAMAVVSGAAARVVSIPPQEEANTLVRMQPAKIDSSPYEEIGEDPGCRSLEVIRSRAVVRKGPSRKFRRRGTVVRGSRLPAYSRVRGPGCADYWYRVHVDGWICGKHVEPLDAPAWGDRLPFLSEGDVTPWPYAFVREPAIEYVSSGGYLEEAREVFKGFGFAVERIVHLDGGAFFRTPEGRLIPRRAAGISGRVSDFEGIPIAGGAPWPVGWVNARRAWVFSAPEAKRKNRIERVDRYSPFEVIEVKGKGARRMVRFDEGAWLRWKDVRVVSEADRPKGVDDGERWIDVDTARQIAVAYEGDTPVYATLVSTGRAGPSRTIKGRFRIWVKVSAIAMDNTDEELDEDMADAGAPDEDRHLFSLQDVPWTQFFHENFALHGVYWHDRFGNRKSHGCVNLAPRDARWFYDWTAPKVPDGWWAIYSTDDDPGTMVRVR